MSGAFVTIRRNALAASPHSMPSAASVRRTVDVAALALALLVFSLRVYHLNNPPKVELGVRAQRLAYTRDLAQRLYNYAEEYGRPVFIMTGVPHPVKAESLEYARLWQDLTNPNIEYRYADEQFSIQWKEPVYLIDGEIHGIPQMGVRRKWPEQAALYAKTRWMAFAPPAIYKSRMGRVR